MKGWEEVRKGGRQSFTGSGWQNALGGFTENIVEVSEVRSLGTLDYEYS